MSIPRHSELIATAAGPNPLAAAQAMNGGLCQRLRPRLSRERLRRLLR